MAYVPNADDPTQPTEDKFVESAAQEFRTLKTQEVRGLRFPVTDVVGNMAELPTAASRAGKLLAFDSVTAQPVAIALLPADVAVSTFMETLLDDANEADARVTLGLEIGTDVLAPNGSGAGLTALNGANIATGDIAAARIAAALNASGNAPLYATRAWVSFNGIGTVAIRASGNVAGITDNGVGDYTINFINAMPDANYVLLGTVQASAAAGISGGGPHVSLSNSSAPAAGSCRIRVATNGGDGAFDITLDSSYTLVAVVR